MQPAHNKPAEPKPKVGRDQHAARSRRCEPAYSKSCDGRVEEHSPAGCHKPQLGEAGEQGTAVCKHRERDQGVGDGDARDAGGLECDEDKQYESGESKR